LKFFNITSFYIKATEKRREMQWQAVRIKVYLGILVAVAVLGLFFLL
jgi:hypothetical protein